MAIFWQSNGNFLVGQVNIFSLFFRLSLQTWTWTTTWITQATPVEALHYLFYCRKTSATSLVTRQVSHNSLSVSQEVWGGDLSAVHSPTEKHIQCGLKYIKICYLQEAVEGTFVYTHVWQEEHGGTEVKCSVETADGSPLCQMTLEYFQPLAKMWCENWKVYFCSAMLYYSSWSIDIQVSFLYDS